MSTKKARSSALINFDLSPKQAFHRSFLRGLAPNALFSDCSFEPAPKNILIKSSAVRVSDALAADWRAIGGDMAIIIDRHAKATVAAE